MLTYGTVAGMERLCMPVLFKEISTDLNLSVVSLGTIWGMDPLAGIFVGVIGGALADRFGMKRTLGVICILAGLFSALRGLSTGFWSLAASMFLFGGMAAMTPSISPKTAAIWFERKQLGLINAFINLSWSVGAMIATMTTATFLSPAVGGWQNALFILSIPAVIVGILWFVTGRDPVKNETEKAQAGSNPVAFNEPVQVPLRQALSHVIHLKEVWLLGFISLALWGANTGFIGYLPLYLRNQGWEPAAADGLFTVFNGASMAGMIPMVLLANRLKAHKRVLFLSLVITVAFMALTPIVSSGFLWAVILTATFLRSAAFAITNVLIFEIKGVGSTYGGTATGLVSSIAMIGAFAAPPLGNSLAAVGTGAPFFFWAGLASISLPVFLLFGQKKALAPDAPS
ncbi:MAG TPA: MFS transporter [Dehalococcoidales bacterium]